MGKNPSLAYHTDKGKSYTTGKDDNDKLSVALPEETHQIRQIYSFFGIISAEQNNRINFSRMAGKGLIT